MGLPVPLHAPKRRFAGVTHAISGLTPLSSPVFWQKEFAGEFDIIKMKITLNKIQK